VKIALLGYGTIGEARARAYRSMEDVELIAIADPTPARLEQAARSNPHANCFSDAELLLSRSAPDAVDICSPPARHADQARLALQHGCHVLCEKPLVTNAGALEGLVALAGRTGMVVYPAHNYRFSPALRSLARALLSGSLGTLVQGHFRVIRTGHALGVPEWRPNWRCDPLIAGGGILTDHGTHCIYLAAQLSGAWPHAVSCVTERNGGVERSAQVRLEAGPAVWSLDLTWTGEKRSTSYMLRGSAGAAIIDDKSGFRHTNGRSSRQPLPSSSSDSTHGDWFPDLFADFRRAISDTTVARRSLAEAVATAVTLGHAYASAEAGGRWLQVELPAVCREVPPPLET
jgi:D-apiose dehydrogenase